MPLISAAMTAQPLLVSVRADFRAAQHFASAQGDLWRPTVSFAAAAGLTPFRQDTLADRYAAAGINVTIPIFNGHLFGAARSEAEARADAESQRVRDTENRIAHDIRVAWLQAGAAFSASRSPRNSWHKRRRRRASRSRATTSASVRSSNSARRS